MKIGVIDSGIGGLSVLSSLIKNCPNHEYIYFGDTIHLPYGEKTEEQIIEYANNIIKFLEKEDVSVIVIACGTISSHLKSLKSNVPLIDIISPLKGKLDNYKKISIMATPMSIKTNAFKQYINCELNLIACPKLVPIIENNDYSKLDNTLKEYLKSTYDSEALILGCTHYPLIKNEISKYFKGNIICLDKYIIDKINELSESEFKLKLYFSAITDKLLENVKRILNRNDLDIERKCVNMLENKKILVLGMARSGYSVAKLIYKNNDVIITDKNDQDENKVKELETLGVKFIKSDTGVELLDKSFDLVIKNPGIEPSHPVVKKANELNIKIVNEMEVAYNYLPKNVKIIGITGSNGKTTTTTILYNLLKLHGIDVILGGNIGYPLSEVVEKVNVNSVLVLEISDHQLYNLDTFKTDISVLTNICPTHLDFHGTYENYKNTKKKIFNHHTSIDKAFINYKNEDSLDITKDILSSKYYFNNDGNYYNEEGIYINNELVIKLSDIKIKGTHNYENILVSLMVLKEFAFDKDIIKEYLSKFNGVEHRIEVVDSKSNIDFYNDSKATNPTSTLTALKTMNKPTHLILGGMERSQDFNELNEYIGVVKCIYAIGEVTDRIFDYAKSMNIECIKCYKLDKAMNEINEKVKNNEIVLLSPASASWDQYDKFETRGEEFKKLVEKLFD